jgi:hypothetical protein
MYNLTRRCSSSAVKNSTLDDDPGYGKISNNVIDYNFIDNTHRMCLKSISDDFGRCCILFDSDVGELFRRIPPVLKLCASFIQRLPRGG